MIALPKWVERAAAILLLVAMIGVVALVGVVPLFAYSARLSDDIEQNAALIARLEKLAAARGTYEAQVASFEKQRTDASVYLPGPSEGVAAADLQQLFTTIVDDRGGALRSTQSLPPESDGGVERIAVQFVLEASVAELADMLADLESRTPYIFVRNLEVQTRGSRRDTAEKKVEPSLLIRLDLYGYLEGSSS